MSQLMIFEDLTYEELKKIYEDMLASTKEGLRPRSLDPYIEQVKEQFGLSTIVDAWKYTEGLFNDEVSRRFFNMQKATEIPVFSGIAAETGEEVSGNALTFEDGEIRIATSCIVDSDIPDLLAVVARKIVDNSVKRGSVKNFVALVKNGSFLVRITDMTILIEKEFIYGSSKRPNPTDYYRKQHYQCG